MTSEHVADTMYRLNRPIVLLPQVEATPYTTQDKDQFRLQLRAHRDSVVERHFQTRQHLQEFLNTLMTHMYSSTLTAQLERVIQDHEIASRTLEQTTQRQLQELLTTLCTEVDTKVSDAHLIRVSVPANSPVYRKLQRRLRTQGECPALDTPLVLDERIIAVCHDRTAPQAMASWHFYQRMYPIHV